MFGEILLTLCGIILPGIMLIIAYIKSLDNEENLLNTNKYVSNLLLRVKKIEDHLKKDKEN